MRTGRLNARLTMRPSGLSNHGLVMASMSSGILPAVLPTHGPSPVFGPPQVYNPCPAANPTDATRAAAANNCIAALATTATFFTCPLEDDANRGEDLRTGLSCRDRQ